MEGYRTIIVALVGGPLAAWLSKHGLDMTPEVQAWFTGAVMSLLMVIMRLVTKSPVGGSGDASKPTSKQGGYARPLMLCFIAAVAFPVMASLPACANFQEVQKLPLDRRIQLAYDEHAEVTRSVTAALQGGQITKGAASNYLELAEGSRKVLDEAKALSATDLKSAEAQLALATDLLTRLQASLISKGAK